MEAFNDCDIYRNQNIMDQGYREGIELPTTAMGELARSGYGFNRANLCLLLLALFAVFNLKNLPGMWHMRILNSFRFILRTQRPQVELNASHIFQPLITESSAELLEIDFNMHKTNSSYFSDLDVSRGHLICTLFAKGIEEMRGGTEAYTGTKHPRFGLALGAASCHFRKEIVPYQGYEMWSRILCWDQKWIYIVTHFVRRRAVKSWSSSLYPKPGDVSASDFRRSSASSSSSSTESDDGVADPSLLGDLPPEKVIFATAISKCVFKSGRKTVSPDAMFEMAGLLPAKGGSTDSEEDREELAKVEERRLEGLKIVNSLAPENQKALEATFGNGDGEILGRHTDGSGLLGVVCTLLQLAGLKRTQAL